MDVRRLQNFHEHINFTPRFSDNSKNVKIGIIYQLFLCSLVTEGTVAQGGGAQEIFASEMVRRARNRHLRKGQK